MTVPGSADPRGELVRFSPRMARTVGLVVGAGILLVMIAAAILVPGTFTIVDRVGFVLLGAFAFYFCFREATVRATASDEHLVVRNLFRTRSLDWAEIIAVSFPQGDPWAHLDLADGDTLAVMALQRADGERGIADARRLAAMVRERGEAPETGI